MGGGRSDGWIRAKGEGQIEGDARVMLMADGR